MTPTRRRSRWRAIAPLALASALVLSACTDGGTDADPPADGGEQPSPTESDGADGTDEPVEPEDKGSLTLAFSNAVPQVEKIPTVIAAEQLQEQGYDVELIWLQSSEDPVQAVVRGDADIGSANVSTVFGAAAQGAPIKALMTQNAPSYAMVAPADVDGPEGLDGLRLGIHAQVSATALYGNLLLEDYPDVQPNTLVVPGSANRIQALIAGELDASVIQLSDLEVLEAEAPGRFQVLYNFADEMTDVIDSAMFVSDAFLAENPTAVEDMIRALLEAQRMVAEDPQILVDSIVEHVPDVSPEQAEEFADVYLASNVWPEDGNFDDDTIARTVEAIRQYGGLESEPGVDTCCDTAPLRAVLGQ